MKGVVHKLCHTKYCKFLLFFNQVFNKNFKVAKFAKLLALFKCDLIYERALKLL